jgi:galactose-1-phosphate uridylyltransferase
MSPHIDRQALARILQAENVERVPFPKLVKLFRQEEGITDCLPDGDWQVDPRDGSRILFHSSRAQRPHDNIPASPGAQEAKPVCVICQGRTTGVIDVADLSEGFTFINKNLYPVLYPLATTRPRRLERNSEPGAKTGARTSYGLHFLQWTSSHHDRDWHNMPEADRVIVLQRMAALENKLLTESYEFLPPSELRADGPGNRAFVLIFKNYGRLVGGSLAHGHQQIVLSNILPKRIYDNWRFENERGETFSGYMLRENPADLLLRDYGPAVLLVPHTMRRPYDMLLLVKDTSKQYVHELTEAEITAVAEGWHDGTRAIRAIMPDIGRETAYNVVTHNGPGAGLYFEFLPYVQETGGLEHLGLLVCQGNPDIAAARLRDILKR